MTSSDARIHSLDSFRGLCVGAMILAFTFPKATFPAWLYGAQFPPPTHLFAPAIRGLTWVDLVLPCFLFALGASIPLSLERRVLPNKLSLPLVRRTGIRFAALTLFAFAAFATNPANMQEQDVVAAALGLIGFAFILLVFTRLPSTWPTWVRLLAPGVGIAGLVLLGITTPYSRVDTLWRAFDPFILSIAIAYGFGAAIWVATRRYGVFRLAIVAMIAAIWVSSTADTGWMAGLRAMLTGSRFLQFEHIGALIVVLAGTQAGDDLIRWRGRTVQENQTVLALPRRSIGMLTGMIVIVILLATAGLKSRYLFPATLLIFVIQLLALSLARRTMSRSWDLTRSLMLLGGILIIAGLLIEPFEGGVRRVPPTLSYFILGAGLATYIFLLVTLVVELKPFRRQPTFSKVGQNAMIGYIAFTHVVTPILMLGEWTLAWTAYSMTIQLLGALALTAVSMLIVYVLTQLEIRVRA